MVRSVIRSCINCSNDIYRRSTSCPITNALPTESETLTGADLERYINVLYTLENGMSCEFCCGARSIIFEDGKAACGCAHSFAMRGLAKHLILNHGDEYTDLEMLGEIGKWSARCDFFCRPVQRGCRSARH